MSHIFAKIFFHQYPPSAREVDNQIIVRISLVESGRRSIQASYIVAQFSKDHAFDCIHFSCSISSIACVLLTSLLEDKKQHEASLFDQRLSWNSFVESMAT
jgi:hypothetical protein